MKYRIELPFRLPSLNDYIRICNRNRFEGNNFKKGVEKDIIWAIKRAKTPAIEKPVRIKYTWIEKNRKRDTDNVSSAKKYILDALQKAKILKNDSPKYVVGHKDIFDYDKINGDRVIIEIEEVEECLKSDKL